MASRRVQPNDKHGAANSHHANDKYMQDWEKAYEELSNLALAEHNPGAGSSSRAGALRLPAAADAHKVPSSYRASSEIRGVSGTLADKDPPAVTVSWRSGPIDPQGAMSDVSDRPNLCSSAHWQRGEVVIGSSDHALYIVDAVKGTRKRTLYSKTCGHSEWVTTCTFLPSGQIVSGGMDSQMWLWPAGGVRGCQILGHGGPVSKVAFDASSGLVASCSYDKTLKLWDMGRQGSPQEVGAMVGHPAPVLEMELSPDGLIATGDRSGHVIVWDSSSCSESWHLKRIHQGHITALAWFDYDSAACAGCFVTGGQDGFVRAWDPRDHTCVSKQELHVNAQGRGAVGDIRAGGAAAADMVVSVGADGTLCISDPRKSFGLVHQIQLSNFPYALAVAGGLALVGCGDGSLWVVHISTGEVCYCLGANKHAVRCIEACEDRLITSGDDGKVMLYHFN